MGKYNVKINGVSQEIPEDKNVVIVNGKTVEVEKDKPVTMTFNGNGMVMNVTPKNKK